MMDVLLISILFFTIAADYGVFRLHESVREIADRLAMLEKKLS